MGIGSAIRQVLPQQSTQASSPQTAAPQPMGGKGLGRILDIIKARQQPYQPPQFQAPRFPQQYQSAGLASLMRPGMFKKGGEVK